MSKVHTLRDLAKGMLERIEEIKGKSVYEVDEERAVNVYMLLKNSPSQGFVAAHTWYKELAH